MQQITLSLHILGALLLWALSFYTMLYVRHVTEAHALQRKLQQLVAGVLVTSVLGLLTALGYSTVTFAVCTKIGLYMLPAFIAIGMIKIKQRNLASESSAR